MEIAENLRMSLSTPYHTCMCTKVVISAMVVSYDTIRGQKTLQETSRRQTPFCLHGFSRQEVPKLPPEAHSSSIETSEGTLKASIKFMGTC